jgi:hypothetical protein
MPECEFLYRLPIFRIMYSSSLVERKRMPVLLSSTNSLSLLLTNLIKFPRAVVFLAESAAAVVGRVTRGILGFVCGA